MKQRPFRRIRNLGIILALLILSSAGRAGREPLSSPAPAFCLSSSSRSVFSSPAPSADRIRAGTIEIRTTSITGKKGLVHIGNLTDISSEESLKLDIVFKFDRGNERVRVYETERVTAAYSSLFKGTLGFADDKARHEMKPSQTASLNKTIPASDCPLTLVIRQDKKTYAIQGKVTIDGIPEISEDKVLTELGNVIRHQETETSGSTRTIEEEIDIRGTLDPDRPGILKGSCDLQDELTGEAKEFIDFFSKKLWDTDVRTTLDWDIRLPVLRIKRDDKDITDILQRESVGKKAKLEAVAEPACLQAEDFRWSLDGPVKKEFSASEDRGEIKALDPDELRKSSIEFFWTDKGERFKVLCSAVVENETLTAKTEFMLQRPEVNVTIAAPSDSLPGFVDGKWELLYGDGAQTGIEFKHEGLTLPGETQWVQLVEGWEVLEGHPKTSWKGLSFRNAGHGIDTSYPYSKNNPTRDTPGMESAYQLSRRSADLKFKMWLMFRPEGNPDEIEWVPLKIVDWYWGGVIAYDDDAKAWMKISSRQAPPGSIKAKDAKTYPEWTSHSDRFPWSVKKSSDDAWEPCPPPKELID